MLAKRNQQDLAIFLVVSRKAIIPLVLVGYVVILAKFGAKRLVGYLSSRNALRARAIIVRYLWFHSERPITELYKMKSSNRMS